MSKNVSILILALVMSFTVLQPVFSEELTVERDLIECEVEANHITTSEDSVKAMLREEGASEDVIDGLMSKLERGELWDSFKEEYRNLKPQIDTPTYKKTVFPDGSMIITEIKEQPSPFIQRESSLHYAYDVQVYKNTILINAYFEMDYIRNTSSGQAKITNQTTPVVDIFDINGAGYAFDLRYGYLRGWRYLTNAWVSFYPQTTTMGDLCWLKGYVNGYGHWVDYSY